MYLMLPLVFLVGAAFASSDAEDPKFIGYWISGTNTQTIGVSNFDSKYTNWTTSGTFAGPCLPEGCWIPVGCENALATGYNGAKIPCLTMEQCQVMTILQAPSDSAIWAKHSGCQKRNFPYSTLYRSLPSVTASTTTSTETSTSATTSPTTGYFHTSPDSPMRTGGDGNDDADEPNSPTSSRAWIAGPVVGGVAFLALVAAFTFWLGRRVGRKNNTDNNIIELPADSPAAIQELKYEETRSPATSTLEYGSAVTTTDSRIHPASELPTPVELANETRYH